MCHESSGVGAGRDDRHRQGLGHARRPRPGRPDHHRRPEPRHQPSADAHRAGEGQEAAARGIVAVNPLPEAGLLRFKNPQKLHGVVGRGTAHRRRVPADQGQRRPGAVPGARPAAAGGGGPAPGTVLDHDFIDRHTPGFDAYETHARPSTGRPCCDGDRPDPRADRPSWPQMLIAAEAHDRLLGDGPDPAPQLGGDDPRDRQPAAAARQHRQARAPASARCAATPTCRATARWASGRRCPSSFLDALDAEFGFDPPARARLSTPSTPSGRCATGSVTVFFGMGGNFVAGDAGHRRSPRRRCALRADRARLDEAEPLATSSPASTALILPTPGPHRERHAGQRRAVRHRRGLDVDGARRRAAA